MFDFLRRWFDNRGVLADAHMDASYPRFLANYTPTAEAHAIIALIRDYPHRWALKNTTDTFIYAPALPQGFIASGGDSWKHLDSSLEISVAVYGNAYIYPEGRRPGDESNSRPVAHVYEKQIVLLLNQLKAERMTATTSSILAEATAKSRNYRHSVDKQ